MRIRSSPHACCPSLTPPWHRRRRRPTSDAVEDAIARALRSLRHRDHSSASLRATLARAGVDDPAQARAIERMQALGYVDDERFARQRAGALAERGAGDRKIAHDLERHGVDRAVAESALGALEPELDRAARVVARRGEGRSTARLLASRGFSEDVIASVVAPAGDWELG